MGLDSLDTPRLRCTRCTDCKEYSQQSGGKGQDCVNCGCKASKHVRAPVSSSSSLSHSRKLLPATQPPTHHDPTRPGPATTQAFQRVPALPSRTQFKEAKTTHHVPTRPHGPARMQPLQKDPATQPPTHHVPTRPGPTRTQALQKVLARPSRTHFKETKTTQHIPACGLRTHSRKVLPKHQIPVRPSRTQAREVQAKQNIDTSGSRTSACLSEPLLGATALPLDSSSNSSYETDHISHRLEEESEMMQDLFESETITPPRERRRLSPNASFADQIQLGLDIAQEFITPITPPRHRSGPFGFPFGPPLDSFSSSFGGRSREFGTAFGTGARPSPLDILSQVLRGHLVNASQNSNRESDNEMPHLDSPPLSTSPDSIPELIPNLQPGESDSSSDDSDTYVPMPPLGEPQLLPELPINPPELGRSNTESSMAVPLLPGLIYIVVSVDDASLAGLHLLSQLDNSGPAPLSESKIEQIPTKLITKEQCETGLQCSICMEEFCIQQSVRVLCCEHCFHNDCIRPWLELHGTCPVCRKTLTSPEDEPNSELQNSSNNILNGASGLAARLSGAVSVSSSSASSSSSLSNSSSDGTTRQRPTITMFII